ncbi:MAG: transporter substrate-binding domain-containing protein [Opitutae bacterium]|nr:transporter substrate-binding domain-containing protein [Opitutae bacterium]
MRFPLFGLCLCGIGLKSFCPTAGLAEETIRLRADAWMPINGEPSAEAPGYAIEIVRAIFPERGVKVDYRMMPWTDALKAVAAGEIEAVIGASKKEAEGLILPRESITVLNMGVYVLKDSTWTYSNISSFSKIRLGAIDGYDYWDALNAYIRTNQPPRVVLFTGEAPLKEAIAKLKGAEIDAMPENILVFTWAVKDAGLKITDFRLAYRHEGEEAYIAFTAHGEAGRRYAQWFDEGMARLRKSGELGKILSKYGVRDW